MTSRCVGSEPGDVIEVTADPLEVTDSIAVGVDKAGNRKVKYLPGRPARVIQLVAREQWLREQPALSGRVFGLVDACFGQVRPMDLGDFDRTLHAIDGVAVFVVSEHRERHLRAKAIGAWAAMTGLGGWVGLRVARSQVKAGPDPVIPARPAPSAEEQAILQLDEVFIRQYDKGDSKALAAM